MANKLNIKSFEKLFKENYQFLVLVSFQITKDKDVAKDIIQEFFINYWEKREHSTIINFKSYASRAVKNLSVSYVRKDERERRKKDQFNADTLDVIITDEYSKKEELSAQLKKEETLNQLINCLPKKRKEIFLAYVKDDLSYDEIAKKYDISINTVKTQMQRSYTFIKAHSKDDKLSALLFSILTSDFLK